MLSKTAWFKLLIVKIQNLRVCDRFKAQVRFKASKGTGIVLCTISAQGGGYLSACTHLFFTFFTNLFNAVFILLSLQYNQSIQYNVRDEG